MLFSTIRQAATVRLQTSQLSNLPSRRFISSSTQFSARKDSQNKDDLKPESSEYSRSASDDEAARVSDTAFDPSQTSPEEQHASAARESGDATNPLQVSPANQQVSKPRGAQEGGAHGSMSETGQGSEDRKRTSGAGSPVKNGR